MITLESKELVGLYLFLKDHEQQLDTRMKSLLTKLERVLFSQLSIEDFESLEEKYKKNQISL